MRRFRLLAVCFFALLLLTVSCAEDDDDQTEETTPPVVTKPQVSAATIVVPSFGLPGGLPIQPANNNLDVVRHGEEVFLAFRTAPNHFASGLARLFVLRSVDQNNWEYETEFYFGTDLREPRLLSFNGRLFLYFAQLGDNPLDFSPGGTMVSERLGQHQWTAAEPVYLDGFMPWRTKVVDGAPYLLGYIGGESIYNANPDPIMVHWLTTQDGRQWYPVIPDQPVVLTGGVSETDFVFLEDGTLIAVSRNELGDQTGYGMKICRAEAGSPGQWECVNDPRKYDSPLMFVHDNQAYLLGRRNLTASGNYDLGLIGLSPLVYRLLNELAYWLAPKRCSLWKIDRDSLEVSFVLDLPSKGDTSFPGILNNGSGSFEIYNYTSPLDGPDVVWVDGQRGPTWIVRSSLQFP